MGMAGGEVGKGRRESVGIRHEQDSEATEHRFLKVEVLKTDG